ncbi:hypothetical protein PR048_025494 [Dryococelus australis]|uniref:Uncharacterized protein n=1 Tax=Dryococelus australis TaxID=614101 RepID=A0ABQ9GRI8_9NEOP|nr:hypothetical protein PR048_025494 [Dryococelus australis]
MSPKRKPQSETYKHNIIKCAREKGLEHMRYKGTSVQATNTGNEKVNISSCKQKYFHMVSEGSRMTILSKFLDLPYMVTQDLHSLRLIEKYDIKTWRPRKENTKRRATSFSYFVMDGNSRKKVCRITFMAMHGIRQP